MKWYSYLICAVLIVLGIFSTVNCVKEFSVKSSVYGSIESIETKNDYNEVFKRDISDIEFESEDDIQYVYRSQCGHVDFDGTKSEYRLLVNDSVSSEAIIKAGKIESVVDLNFYNTDGEKITTATLKILIEFLDSQTVITMSMINEYDSISYFNQYVCMNGLILKVVERG